MYKIHTVELSRENYRLYFLYVYNCYPMPRLLLLCIKYFIRQIQIFLNTLDNTQIIIENIYVSQIYILQNHGTLL